MSTSTSTNTNTRKRLMPYPEERALEYTAYAVDALPTQIHAVLLPVWSVEVEADVTEGEPYELIDRYLERGISEAGLGTAGELASFFALESAVVGQALRFLTRIGHLAEKDGRIGLTPLGEHSVRDQVRYVHTRKDRRKLYFDAFACRPLTRAYYDVRKVAFLSGDTLQEALDRRDGPRHQMLSTTRGFRREALTELAVHPDRDRYNLPDRIDNPRSVDSESQIFLPAYIVRAVERGGRVRHLVYTPAGDGCDKEITAVCEATPGISSALEAEEVAARRVDFEAQAERWLSRRNLAHHRLVKAGNGAWRVTLPRDCFGADRALGLAKLGSFQVLGTAFFQVWCTDDDMRRRALVERIDSYLSQRFRVDQDAVQERINGISRQLDLGAVSVDDLRRAATKAGKRSLAAQLARLAKEPNP